MQISLNIRDEKILDKLFSMLERFKSDEIEIIKPKDKSNIKSATYEKLETLNTNMGGNELLQYKLQNLSKQYSYNSTQTDDEILYAALKEKHGN